MSTGKEGKEFEELIEWANRQYLERGLAVIQKIPTPWNVKRKYNPYNKQYEIYTAYPEEKSTVDFGGTAKNYSIWFDAKTTKLPTNFPLKNIKIHQLDYLRQVKKQGGKAFLLIYSQAKKTTWLLWVEQLLTFIETEKRKSIPFEWLNKNCPVIGSKNGIILDYLPEVLKTNRS